MRHGAAAVAWSVCPVAVAAGLSPFGLPTPGGIALLTVAHALAVLALSRALRVDGRNQPRLSATHTLQTCVLLCFYGAVISALPFTYIASIVIAASAEEFVYRGAIDRQVTQILLSGGYSRRAAVLGGVLLSAASFAISHAAVGSIPARRVAELAVAGVFLSVAARAGRLESAIAAHAAYNLLQHAR